MVSELLGNNAEFFDANGTKEAVTRQEYLNEWQCFDNTNTTVGNCFPIISFPYWVRVLLVLVSLIF